MKRAQPSSREDVHWMRRALQLAKRGLGCTSPNPPVGAVLVRDGEIIGEGWHRQAGGPHAEIEALRSAGWPETPFPEPESCTLYVTLEPCSTHGKTPACTDAILESGIGRVVWAVDDPNPQHAGRAKTLLAERTLRYGILKRRAEKLIRPWATSMREGRPWIILKAGMTLDGKITLPGAASPWITTPEARQHAMRTLRGRVDAILVGAETIRQDDPSLNYRGEKERPPLWRIVVSKSGHLPEEARVFTDDTSDHTLVYHDQPWQDILAELHARGIVQLLVEGGGKVAGSLADAGLIDEVAYYIAPTLGLHGTPVIDGARGPISLEDLQVRPVGGDLLIHGYVAR